jgi:hypothetical protein
MRHKLKLFWLFGFLVGTALYCFWHLHNRGELAFSDPDTLLVLQNFTLLLWPSSLMLMSVSGEHPLSTFIIVAISLCSNGFIYLGFGYLVSKLFVDHAPGGDSSILPK